MTAPMPAAARPGSAGYLFYDPRPTAPPRRLLVSALRSLAESVAIASARSVVLAVALVAVATSRGVL